MSEIWGSHDELEEGHCLLVGYVGLESILSAALNTKKEKAFE